MAPRSPVSLHYRARGDQWEAKKRGPEGEGFVHKLRWCTPSEVYAWREAILAGLQVLLGSASGRSRADACVLEGGLCRRWRAR